MYDENTLTTKKIRLWGKNKQVEELQQVKEDIMDTTE